MCLVLGTGGLGCGVALGLARMGVKKIILLDKECVELSNLNRQILFTKEDVGKPKATTAKARLVANHVVGDKTEVVALQMDALTNWQTIVQHAEEADVVFNLIDVGEYFDVAVQSLCMKKKKLLLQGGTFCQQLNVDMFKPG